MLLSSPTISDRQLAQALGWVVAIAVPLLDRVAETDPLHLKQRVAGHGSSRTSHALDRAAALVQSRSLPGTEGWEAKPISERSRWWANRIGGIGSAMASVPSVFGALASRFPVQDALGFATQAVALCAVAREHGVTDRAELVQLLAEVLCGRKLSPTDLAAPVADPPPHGSRRGRLTAGAKVASGLWQIARIAWSFTGELGKRPHGPQSFHYLSKLPVVGAVGGFLYENAGVHEAVAEGERWLASGGQVPAEKPRSWLAKLWHKH